MAREIFVDALMIGGAAFMFLASLGVLRMPDLYTRMSATSKAATLGSGLVMLAAAVYFSEFSITVRVLAIIVFLLLTVPVAAHMIGRAAYFDGVPLWEARCWMNCVDITAAWIITWIVRLYLPQKRSSQKAKKVTTSPPEYLSPGDGQALKRTCSFRNASTVWR